MMAKMFMRNANAMQKLTWNVCYKNEKGYEGFSLYPPTPGPSTCFLGKHKSRRSPGLVFTNLKLVSV